MYRKNECYCSEIIEKDTNQTLFTLNDFEIMGLNEIHGYFLSNKDNKFIYYNL